MRTTLVCLGTCVSLSLALSACSKNKTEAPVSAPSVEDQRKSIHPAEAAPAQPKLETAPKAEPAPALTPTPVAKAKPAHPIDYSLSKYAFEQTPYGFKIENPVHNLRMHFRPDVVTATRTDKAWHFAYRLRALGREAVMHAVQPARPELRDGRLEYRRGALVEWYVNTVLGIEQGMDLATRPAGAGRLIVEADISGGFVGEATATQDSVVFEGHGTRLAYKKLIVNDATGRQLESSMMIQGSRLRLVIDDSAARYPLTIDPQVASCDDAWCNDGDSTTVDTCSVDDYDNVVCSSVYDSANAGEACGHGGFCCDGVIAAECNAGLADDCPAGWCNDGDPTTKDMCSNDEWGIRTCTNELDSGLVGEACGHGAHCCDGVIAATCEAAGGTDCPAGWCNDGDPTTTDGCTEDEYGTRMCVNALEGGLLGESCGHGQFCCGGVVKESCDEMDAAMCPAGWCNDGDPTTADTCKVNLYGVVTCEHAVDGGLLGESCGHGQFCCDGVIDADCAAADGADCPAGWCNDGDVTTKDSCSQAGEIITCANEMDGGLLGEACGHGAYCCNGIVAEECGTDGATECPAGWCNDGDDTTVDTCTELDGLATCTNAVDPATEGDVCAHGLYCCNGKIAADCASTPEEIEKAKMCPAAWCNDGDPSTSEKCVKDGEAFTCEYGFKEDLEGQPCFHGQFCCADGRLSASCN
jgi:hypothetical protein